jgi:hypothetical protein
MNKDEALKMAIEALNKLARLGNGDSYGNSDGNCIAIKTLKAIEEALERPAQEPVAWMNDIAFSMDKELLGTRSRIVPLYTHPAPSWQGLTEDEILEIPVGSRLSTARSIEQALKEKNHG